MIHARTSNQKIKKIIEVLELLPFLSKETDENGRFITVIDKAKNNNSYNLIIDKLKNGLLTKKYKLNNKLLLSDTVGFIDKLPTTLVAAFRATLEEIEDSNLIIHVLDVSDKELSKKFETSNKILKDLGYDKKPTIIVLNKIDKLKDYHKNINQIDINQNSNIIGISALKKINIEDLIIKLSYITDQIR